MSELKPCPFCGVTPVTVFVGDDDGGYYDTSCGNCYGQSGRPFCGAHADTQAEAEKIWNTSAHPTPANSAEDEMNPQQELDQIYLKRRDLVIRGYQKECREVEQTLGKALGYPWFKDDQKNFPGSTEKDGVCIGEHVPATIAAEAAHRITTLEAQLEAVRGLPRHRVEVMKSWKDGNKFGGSHTLMDVIFADDVDAILSPPQQATTSDSSLGEQP